MLTFMWFILTATVVLLGAGCNRGRAYRLPGCVSWFDIQPFMQLSKKAKGKAQQRKSRR